MVISSFVDYYGVLCMHFISDNLESLVPSHLLLYPATFSQNLLAYVSYFHYNLGMLSFGWVGYSRCELYACTSKEHPESINNRLAATHRIDIRLRDILNIYCLGFLTGRRGKTVKKEN